MLNRGPELAVRIGSRRKIKHTSLHSACSRRLSDLQEEKEVDFKHLGLGWTIWEGLSDCFGDCPVRQSGQLSGGIAFVQQSLAIRCETI